MSTTYVPDDLYTWRQNEVAPTTGLSGDDLGIAPNATHKGSGGYHCGVQDIINIGEYPDGDYSTRQPRDRVGGNVACAFDLGDDWPHGGRAAWLRYNNMVVAQMMAKDPALAALRAVNFSPDGTATKRYDSLHPEQGIINSTDSVYMHTHHEWWRDTEGKRDACLARLTEIMHAAINNTPLGDEMELTDPVHNTQTPQATAGRNVDQVLGDLENERNIGRGEIVPSDPRYPKSGTPARAALELPSAVGAVKTVVDQTLQKVTDLQAGQVSQDALNAAVAKALQTPEVLAAIATAVADEQYRRQAQ